MVSQTEPSDPTGRDTSTPFHARANSRPLYYKPSLYRFSCRGALKIQPKPAMKPEVPFSGGSSKQEPFFKSQNEVESYLESQLKDNYICRGIESKLRHVADYPPARSLEEALRSLEGSYSDAEYRGNAILDKADAAFHSKSKKPNIKKPSSSSEEELLKSFSPVNYYGTTKVDVLTVQVVPALSAAEIQSQIMDDPFLGFGAIAPTEMLKPFGSLFGGFFGGAGANFDPWNSIDQIDGHKEKPNQSNWMRSSRSVSSSTRTHRDEQGKRIATTVTKTTIVDADGSRRTEIETTIRHIDEGGRVETKKTIQTDRSGLNELDPPKQEPLEAPKEMTNRDTRGPSSHIFNPLPASSSFQVPMMPPIVAAIAAENLFGLSIADSKSDEAENPNVPKLGDPDKWRKTEYLFRLGRFIPPFMIVSQYYKDDEEEERRRRQQQREYEEKRQRQRQSRWSKSSERDQSIEKNNEKSGDQLDRYPVPTNLPIDASRVKYYLQRLDDQMESNFNMMKVISGEMIKKDFPKKVYHSGQKIIDNMGPTAERAVKLMKDVCSLWFGELGWEDGENGHGSGGRKR